MTPMSWYNSSSAFSAFIASGGSRSGMTLGCFNVEPGMVNALSRANAAGSFSPSRSRNAWK